MYRSLLYCLVVICLVFTASGADWPQFRGPSATGSSADRGVPTTWSDNENIAWRTRLPGPGASSPITFGDRVFVTCYSGYGVSREEPGNESDLVRHVVCLDGTTGEVRWDRELTSNVAEAPFRGFMTEHGYASSTPATDGERVYAFFGPAGVFAFDLEGKQLWRADVGVDTDQWGSASSVVLFDDVVIVNATMESGAVVGLDKKTGKQRWLSHTSGRTWSTPALVKVPGKPTELVLSVEGDVVGLDPRTGKDRWICEGIDEYTCPCVVPGEGVVYIVGGRRNTMLAIRAGGVGDVSGSHLLWRKNFGANVTTPALLGDRLYGVTERGIAYCVDTTTGDVIYEKRMPTSGAAPMFGGPPGGGGFGGRPGRGGGGGGGQFYASVVAADERLYAVSRTQGTFVLAAGDEFEVLGQNRITDDPTSFDATPALGAGRLLVRSGQHLYCIRAQ